MNPETGELAAHATCATFLRGGDGGFAVGTAVGEVVILSKVRARCDAPIRDPLLSPLRVLPLNMGFRCRCFERIK